MTNDRTPITEADLHAYADGQLSEARRLEVEAYLATRPDDQARVHAWIKDNVALRDLFAPVLAEPIPVRIPVAPSRQPGFWSRFAIAASIAVFSATLGWLGRGAFVDQIPAGIATREAPLDSTAPFARRAAVAHVVYSPEVRRPVEVAAEQEDQLVAWLSKRLDAPVKPPHLGRIGYELIGGRLLPGDRGPVAQFMYHDASGQRLTLYVTREAEATGDRAFRFSKEGPVSVFYWIDGRFGYALSAGIEKDALHKVAQEVYRQLAPN
ncbi:MAG: anti-sigma factor family protein [Terriglobales bacterium]